MELQQLILHVQLCLPIQQSGAYNNTSTPISKFFLSLTTNNILMTSNIYIARLPAHTIPFLNRWLLNKYRFLLLRLLASSPIRPSLNTSEKREWITTPSRNTLRKLHHRGLKHSLHRFYSFQQLASVVQLSQIRAAFRAQGEERKDDAYLHSSFRLLRWCRKHYPRGRCDRFVDFDVFCSSSSSSSISSQLSFGKRGKGRKDEPTTLLTTKTTTGERRRRRRRRWCSQEQQRGRGDVVGQSVIVVVISIASSARRGVLLPLRFSRLWNHMRWDQGAKTLLLLLLLSIIAKSIRRRRRAILLPFVIQKLHRGRHRGEWIATDRSWHIE